MCTVMAMYEGVQTVFRTAEGDNEALNMKVGLHQGSVLRPLFVIVIEVITKELRVGLPWELLYADDLILKTESETELHRKIGETETWYGS